MGFSFYSEVVRKGDFTAFQRKIKTRINPLEMKLKNHYHLHVLLLLFLQHVQYMIYGKVHPNPPKSKEHSLALQIMTGAGIHCTTRESQLEEYVPQTVIRMIFTDCLICSLALGFTVQKPSNRN